MTTARFDVLMWAKRVMSRKGGPAHTLLEVPATCTPEQAQEAFHKIARTAHPDLHRNGLSPEELEMVTSAYATVAGAYMTLRSQTAQTTRMRPIAKDEPSPSAPPSRGAARTPPAGAAAAPPIESTGLLTGDGPANPTELMSQRALNHFRKAESALKRGDLKGAVLQLKLACAADSSSTFLRNALAEVDAELRRAT